MKAPLGLFAAAVLSACATSPSSETKVPLSPAELDVARAGAVCARGAATEERSFIFCQGGRTSINVFRETLRGESDDTLDLEQIAVRYGVPLPVLTGIKPATYSDIVPNRQRLPLRSKAEPDDTVTVDGRVFDVYRVSRGQETGTVFVERRKT